MIKIVFFQANSVRLVFAVALALAIGPRVLAQCTAPYSIPKFQVPIAECKLQAPNSSTAATQAELIAGYCSSWFYVDDTDKMAFYQQGSGKRTELRYLNNWYVNAGDRSAHANLQVIFQTCDQVTLMQIHDDAGAGPGPNKPLLRIYRHLTKTPVDHIWAAIKTDAGGSNTEHVDLGPTPTGYFDCDITITGGNMSIAINGATLATRDVSFWTFPSYWKAGVYLQDNGNATAHFNELTWTEGANQPPAFTSDPINKPDANEDVAYSDSIAADATDPDTGDTLTFSKVSGPAWLNVAANGALSGTPANSDVGANAFTVRVADNIGAFDDATLNVTVINANDAPTFTSDPIGKPDATDGQSYSDTLAGDATDVDAGDVLTFSKVSGPAWLNVATDGTLSGTPGTGNVGNNNWTVEVTDLVSASDQAGLNITVNSAPEYPFDDNTTGDLPVDGSVAGSHSDTHSSDNVYQSLTEDQSGGNPSRRRSSLEHKWTVDVTGGDLITLFVEAHHTVNGEGDDFIFGWSADGSSYTDVLTVTKTSDDNSLQSVALPNTLGGTVYIRVVDADNSQGNSVTDTLHIDRLFIRSDELSGPPAVATNPDPADGANGVSTGATLSWSAGAGATSHDVYFGTNPSPGGGELQGNQTGTEFNPGALAASTTYYWAIDEVNSQGTTAGPVWSFTTGAANPDMHVSAITLSVVAAGGPNYRGQAMVSVVDSGTGQPVQGATVSGTFSGDFNESQSAATDASGQATITTGAKKKLPLSLAFCVDDVTGGGHTYNAGNNVETCDSGSF